jgi:3-oxoacyl-[acyl-carrier-protein] synthase III
MPESVGIAAIASYIPAGVETAGEMSEKSGFPEYVFVDMIGIRQKPVAAPGEHPTDMAIQAALDAIDKARIRPDSIDLVLFCGGGLYDYGVWSPAAKVQHEIGASKAFSYEIRNGCNGGNLGLYLASRQLLADPDLQHALVVCSDIFSRFIDYSDDKAIAYFPGGDGATAAVLTKGHPDNRLLSYAGLSDGSVADAMFVPLGGTRVPWTAESIAAGLGTLRISNPAQLAFVFSDLYSKNFMRVVREAMRKCGRSVEEINFLFTNQVRKRTLHEVFEDLGLPLERTLSTMEQYGHLSASDTLLALSLALEAGAVHKGDLVVLASSGMGFHWAATVLEH